MNAAFRRCISKANEWIHIWYNKRSLVQAWLHFDYSFHYWTLSEHRDNLLLCREHSEKNTKVFCDYKFFFFISLLNLSLQGVSFCCGFEFWVILSCDQGFLLALYSGILDWTPVCHIPGKCPTCYTISSAPVSFFFFNSKYFILILWFLIKLQITIKEVWFCKVCLKSAGAPPLAY